MNLHTSATFDNQLSSDVSAVSLSEVISAMTFALDLTEGAFPGHALRSCLLAMRLGKAVGVPEDQLNSLYYAALLKDIGCSSNASRMTQLVQGDDRAAKSAAKLSDWTKHRQDLRTVTSLWKTVAPGKSLPTRVARMLHLARNQHVNNREMVELRCERGAEIVRHLEMGETVASTVRRLDEHWDGSGYPNGLCGSEIPLLSRICNVAQTLDVFAMEDGEEAAMDTLRSRKGTWFDPELVRAASGLHKAGELWQLCGRKAGTDGASIEATRQAVLELDPRMMADMKPHRIDQICEAFAGVVDAKSPFTYRHSVGVADVAVEIAREMGLPEERVQLVRRAALLHDIGKLRVPNSILDKRGKLTPEEWTIVLEHPGLSRSILERVQSFSELAAMAGEHHEKLDGSGYPWGLKGEDMSLESKLLAVADVFTALAEDRPYRVGLDLATIHGIMSREVPEKLDESCYEALLSAATRWPGNRPSVRSVTSLPGSVEAGWYSANEPPRAMVS